MRLVTYSEVLVTKKWEKVENFCFYRFQNWETCTITLWVDKYHQKEKVKQAFFLFFYLFFWCELCSPATQLLICSSEPHNSCLSTCWPRLPAWRCVAVQRWSSGITLADGKTCRLSFMQEVTAGHTRPVYYSSTRALCTLLCLTLIFLLLSQHVQ